MTTTAATVGRALRLIQVIDAAQPVKNIDMQAGIEALNAMMRRWEANGLSLGWQPVENPSDELPVPPEAEEAVAYNLAIRLAPEYGVMPSPPLAGGAMEFLMELRRDQAVATPIQPILDAPVPDRWNDRQWHSNLWWGS